MKSAYDAVLERVKPGTELRTPDAASGKPFQVDAVDSESISVRTARGGRVKMSLFTFDSAIKYIEDMGGDWLPVKDEMFQSVLNMENDRVRASSRDPRSRRSDRDRRQATEPRAAAPPRRLTARD
ncbi:MAG: hypothetical protein ACYS0F_00655 [Planctomycetota bacterium]|jgi:hypothetical protein